MTPRELRRQQEMELWSSYKAGNKKSLSPLLSSFDPLLQQQVNRYSAAPIPREALETEARMLAVKAFDTYDPNKGAQLNTHVTNHLKHLQRYTLKYHNIGAIPDTRGIKISRYQNVFSNLTEELNREPSILELSDALQMPPIEVERLQIELRKDLTIQEAGDSEEGFFDYSGGISEDATLKTAIEYVIFDSAPEDQKIIEATFGIGQPRKSVAEISLMLGKPESYVRKRLKMLAEKIKEAEMYS